MIESVVAAPKTTPKPTSRPTPKPTPDVQTIPKWAQGKVINSVPVKPGNKVFALTFDDGPWPHYTREVLQVLKRHNVKATFFVVGQELIRRPEIAREVKAAGHALGGHSWDHPSRPRNAVSQVKRTDAALKSIGVKSTIFRPPYGMLKNGMARQAMKDGQAVLIWSADSGDWKRSGASTLARRVINQASPGGIALLHDGGGARSQTVAALSTIIESLKARGYRFVTVPELLRMRYVAPPKPKAKAKAKTQAKQSRKKPVIPTVPLRAAKVLPSPTSSQ